ncbi:MULTISPECIES: hypothetical protein [Bacillus cereus group]|nr:MULTISPECIES: hypothetical protein [Bacillus cereus group]ANC08793.1 hypothetical protein WR47_17375 [Bacillus cereus]ANC14610.1 hypothetical protein WR51_17375 [Bacillus cereus]MDA1995228.1 hypothetical protein [Bacillus cereus]MDA2000186.1 hypothetical protein [Bacillus cereus]MDA2518088.1 hypothetical protein [Bacillus cereus]
MKEYRSINKITRLSGHPKWKDEITNYIKKSYSRIADKIEREEAKRTVENKKVDKNTNLTVVPREKEKSLRKR